MPKSPTTPRRFQNCRWKIMTWQIIEMHDTAKLKLDAGELSAYTNAREFLNSIWSKVRHPGFDITHKQLLFLCRLCGARPEDYIEHSPAYEAPEMLS